MSHASAAAPWRLAVAVIGRVTLGIDVAALVQAMPVPDPLTSLPRRQGALAGVIDCRGELVPVVDLARWVDTGPATGDAAGRRILVLHEGGRRIGLLVDAIEGFADVSQPPQRMHRDDDPDEVCQSVVKVPSSGVLLCVLEVARLVELTCAWHEGDVIATAPEPAADMPGVERTLCAVLQAGPALLALPAVRLAAVVALPALERVGTGGTAFCRWNGRHVAVVSGTAAALAQRPLLAIVEHGGAVLGVPVDAALDMRALSLPEAGAPATIHDDSGAPIECIDVPALFGRHPESALSLASAAAATAARGGTVNDAAQLLFDAGGTLATPIAAVEQVLPLDSADGSVAATMPWRGRTIAVTDLRSRAGEGAILVVRRDDRHVACVVERVRSMVPPGGGQVYTMTQPGQREPARFITVAGEGGALSYRIVALGD